MTLDLKPVRGGRRHRHALALKMAWRDIFAHKGRSILTMLLIALPIAMLSGAATLGQSMLPTPQETALHQLGQAQARLGDLHANNGAAVQSVEGDGGFTRNTYEADKTFVPTKPVDAVPAGYRAITLQTFQMSALSGKVQVALSGAVATDVLDPAFAGKYTLLSGSEPVDSRDVLVSPGLLARFGKSLGDELTTPAGSFRLSGTLRDAGTSDGNVFLYVKASQLRNMPAELAATGRDVEVYLVGSKPVTWQQIKGFNARGIQVMSRQVLLHRPTAQELGSTPGPASSGNQDYIVGTYILYGSLVGVLALLEVGLLAGAAFAVGARKQQRDLALLAASGAETFTIGSVVLAGGVWLGALGGAVGAACVQMASPNRGGTVGPGRWFHGSRMDRWRFRARSQGGRGPELHDNRVPRTYYCRRRPACLWLDISHGVDYRFPDTPDNLASGAAASGREGLGP